MEAKVFSLFGATGIMEEIKLVKNLPMFCKVFIYGFGMSEAQGAIISGPDQYGSYKVVKISDYEPGFSSLDKYSRPHSKKFGIGIYYDDNLNTWPESEVNKYIKLAEIATKKAKDEAEAKSKADEAEKKSLPSLFPHLVVNFNNDHKTTKVNMVTELRKNFPGVKFSVVKEHYDTYGVTWTNGPTTSEVTKITGKFEDSENDWSGDYRDYAPSNFNRVFGGFKYVFENRHISEEINNLLPELKILLGNYEERHPEQILYRIVSKTSISASAYNFRLTRNEITCGQIEDFYNLTFDVK